MFDSCSAIAASCSCAPWGVEIVIAPGLSGSGGSPFVYNLIAGGGFTF